VVKVIKAPYAKLYTILKTQTMSESENEPVGEEVGILIGWIMVISICTEPEEVTSMELNKCGHHFIIPCPVGMLCEI
jgi:hypothetical protein